MATTHASLREDSETIHHITSETGITGILATAGLLAEAINFRLGFNSSGAGRALDLSVLTMGLDDVVTVDEFQIREVGKFWLMPDMRQLP